MLAAVIVCETLVNTYLVKIFAHDPGGRLPVLYMLTAYFSHLMHGAPLSLGASTADGDSSQCRPNAVL
jgi:hypothetical protein